MHRAIRAVALVAGILALTAGAANAQARGQIFGKATDASGGVLPGVTVTVTGGQLQQPLVQVTTETGAYQFPVVPIGNYTVTFELNGFKRTTRQNVPVTSGFNAEINATMEVGAMTEEVTVSAAAPVVDTKRTTTGGTFTAEILEKIPTARDPWQIINMTPGVQAGLNVGGSSSGQQVGLQSRGTGASVQWNLEGGSITDLSSNSSPSYFNFDAFEQISVVNGGGDVSVQSSGLSINLITKSGSNVFKGSAVGTFENDKMQNRNVDEDLFSRGTGGFLSGNPIKRIYTASIEYGGPLLKNKLWWWAAADRQDINVGVLNFFDRDRSAQCATFAEAQRTGQLEGLVTFADLDQVQDCLANDKTLIKNLQGKLNFTLNPSHKFQYMLTTDSKFRNARGASANTAKEATTQQTSDAPWKLPLQTHQGTHTWIANDRLVFNTMYTHVKGGFFLDYQDFKSCGGNSRYLGSDDFNAYLTGPRADANCLWNQQSLSLRTTGFRSRSLTATYQTVRPSHELKTDGTYFLTNVLGGDHSLKFGAGYRKNPILSFSHYSGGGRALVQCVGNRTSNCGDGQPVPVGSATGIVPYRAELYRDQLRNNNWWSYNGYIQDSYSYKRLRVNAGLRFDWQQSEYLGGCVPANIIRPDLLPAQCEEATSSGVDPNTGQTEEIQPFSNWSPRMSLTYDLTGTGKTVLRASGSHYYATKITLADSLGGLFTVTRLRWTNNSSGTCGSTSCWTDANRDTVIQANELMGTPVSSSSRFDPVTGILTPAGNSVDESTKIARTREATVGMSHELMSNFALGVDVIYRRYDRGTITYTVGFQPGAPGFPISNLYTGPFQHTDPVTGNTGNYYTICATCQRPSGLGSIIMTNPNYQTYLGADFTINKRYSDRWQLNMALTVQRRNDYTVEGGFTDPQDLEYRNGLSTLARYIFKLNGSYDLPWGVTASMNLNVNDGAVRVMEINGPGDVFGGVGQGQIGRDTIEFQPRNTTRYDRTQLLDLSLQKTFSFRGGQNRIKVMIDGFNMLNTPTVLDYSSDNLSLASNTRVSGIIPPRVFRVGMQINF